MTAKFPMSQPGDMPLYGSLYVGDRAKYPGKFLRKIEIEMVEKIIGAPAMYETIA